VFFDLVTAERLQLSHSFVQVQQTQKCHQDWRAWIWKVDGSWGAGQLREDETGITVSGKLLTCKLVEATF
jgi:hypothetical protein